MSKALDLMLAAHGQCRLTYQSATALLLSPFGGQNLNIGGRPQAVPSAGVTVANTGLLASTTYYVYAYMSGTTMALELSTTGHSATNGVETKTGDITRTLVGMCRTNGSTPGQFFNSLTAPGVLNFFNRRDIVAATATVSGSTSSTSFAEISASARLPFLCWADEGVDIQVIGSVSNSSAGNIAHSTSASVDAATGGAQTVVTSFTSGVSFPAFARSLSFLSEGLHTASAFGQVGSGTGTWSFGVQIKTRG